MILCGMYARNAEIEFFGFSSGSLRISYDIFFTRKTSSSVSINTSSTTNPISTCISSSSSSLSSSSYYMCLTFPIFPFYFTIDSVQSHIKTTILILFYLRKASLTHFSAPFIPFNFRFMFSLIEIIVIIIQYVLHILLFSYFPFPNL